MIVRIPRTYSTYIGMEVSADHQEMLPVQLVGANGFDPHWTARSLATAPASPGGRILRHLGLAFSPGMEGSAGPSPIELNMLLLMEEILHHLKWLKSYR